MVMQNNPLTKFSVQQLKQAVAIRERIDGLETELARILDVQSPATRNAARRKGRLSAAGRGRLSAMMKARWAKRKGQKSFRIAKAARAKGKASERGQLKGQIIRNLKSAGKAGVAVKDLATKLGKSYGNISVWFHTTAKGVKEIKKVAPGRFAWAS